MRDKNLEELHDKNAIPSLLLEGLVPMGEVLQSIRLGEYTCRWIAEQILDLAGIKPETCPSRGVGIRESAFDTPKAVAAMHCLDLLIESPSTREGMINYIWKSVGCRHQDWLTIAAEKLSANTAILLALGKPEGSIFAEDLRNPNLVLMGRISSMPDHQMVDFANHHACFTSLYDLTRNRAVLQAAEPSDRDKIMAVDLGL